jgi:BolA family transcriptional regulator, general stress-responsive regulator
VDKTDLIRQKLSALEPVYLELVDDSHHHIGHEGARDGGGHYTLVIVSRQFAGKPAVIRHRMVYDVLGEMMRKDIHALSVKAYTPEEV